MLDSKLCLIRSLSGEEGLSEEAIRQINELYKQLDEINKAEHLVCYELDALRKDAKSLIKQHSYGASLQSIMRSGTR